MVVVNADATKHQTCSVIASPSSKTGFDTRSGKESHTLVPKTAEQMVTVGVSLMLCEVLLNLTSSIVRRRPARRGKQGEETNCDTVGS